MKVIVFGATGKTGQHVWTEAVDRGHEVTAFGRSVDRLADAHPDLATAKGNVFNTDDVSRAVAGHEGAIVCIGSSGLRDVSTLTKGTTTVIAAMEQVGARRLVVMSAAGVGDSFARTTLPTKLVIRTLLRNIYADHATQEAAVAASSLDWTIVRAAVLTDKPATGDYTASNEAKVGRITRADVAAYLVSQLDDDANRHATITVTS